MNVLKTNNRFSSLLEDNRPVHSRNVGVSRYINKYNPDIKSIKINNVNTTTNINMNDFPELIPTRTNAHVGDVAPNYVTKLLHQTNIAPEKEEVLPYGWIALTHNNNHNVNPSITIKPSWENAMDSLVKLYNKRKDEYIAMWGEETYETIFLFPNYDYNYNYMYFDDEADSDYEYDYEDDEDYEYNEYYN